MATIWTSPETKTEVRLVIVKNYEGDEPMFLVHKEGASSVKFVFGVRARDCREA